MCFIRSRNCVLFASTCFHPRFFGGVRVFITLVCCGVSCCVSLLYEFRVICAYLRTLVSNTYSVVFLLCFSLSCLLFVASFFGLSFLIAPSVFSNAYLLSNKCNTILHNFEFFQQWSCQEEINNSFMYLFKNIGLN